MSRIELRDVSLTFRLRHGTGPTLKDRMLGGLLGRPPQPGITVESLRHVSTLVKDGDRVGILGANGAGKSTLLRVMAGVYPPSGGSIVTEGKIVSLFDLNLGFEQNATGWDNIAYRGYLQGETPRSIRAKQDEIAAFSELGDFLDMPIRFYSSGMLVRLAFSIATSIDPEILLIDEILAAGDMAFQAKARGRVEELATKAPIVVVVSHDMEALCKLTNRGLWLEKGQIRGDGPTTEIAEAYAREVTGAEAVQPGA